QAQNYTKEMDYDNAIEYYRKAGLILNEIHFPTDSINLTISKLSKLKDQKLLEKELELQRELEKIEEEKEIAVFIEERKRQEEEQRRAQNLAMEEREKIIKEQRSQREAAFSLLEEAAKYLKSRIPDYDKAISLYFQARNILAEKIGWEPEINNLNNLIRDLQQEKADYLEKQRLEAQIQLKRQQEYSTFQEEMRRKQLDYEIQMEDQRAKLELFEERKKYDEEARDRGLKFIDEGKKYAKFNEFDKAYDFFNKAISQFQEIGWTDQIHYIQTEIKNTKILEEKTKKEEKEVQKLQEEVQTKLKGKIQKQKADDLYKQETVSEVTSLADEVSRMIKDREDALKLAEIKRKDQILVDAKEFSKSMGKMLSIKQELLAELKKAEDEEKRKKEDLKKAKEREEVDEIKRMLKGMKKK
ncbi:MAG: hypothetical protein ACFFAO_19890, partial [Candidatus Hermodarchaeota archaeon]